MRRRRTLLPAALALVAVAALPAVTGAQPGLSGPQPKLMVITSKDVGHVSYVKNEGATTEGPIAASRGWQRTFTGLTPGTVQLLTVRDAVLVGKTPTAAARWLSSFIASSSSTAGQAKLQAQAAKTYADTTESTVTSGTMLRARTVRAGDAAAEIVFRLVTDDRDAIQVGQLYVRVGSSLSVISFTGAMPGLSPTASRELALVAAARMKEGGATA